MNPIAGNAASLDALTEQYRVITTNIANSSTVGFKRSQTAFADALAGQLGSQESAGAGSSVVGSTYTDFTPGALVQTGRSLDVALSSDGFFAVESPGADGGVLYTRNGAFQVNTQRQLVDSAGRIVQGESGPIVISSDVSESAVTVSSDGSVSAGGQAVGKLKVVTFENAESLQQVSSTLYEASADAQPQTAATVAVHQGYQEASNVSAVDEMVNLIMVSRLYEANIKTISAQDDRMKSILQVAAS